MITYHLNRNTVSLMFATGAVNPFSRAFQQVLGETLSRLEADSAQLNGIVIGFDADSDWCEHEITHLLELTQAQAGASLHMLASYNALLRRLERLGKPVIGALTGKLCGHALGLALACHQRVSLADATFSLPQVKLGLTPVGGVSARLVRLTGLQTALQLLTEGRTIDAAQAHEAGLLLSVAASAVELAEQVREAIEANPAPLQPWDSKGFRLPGGALSSPALQTLLQLAPAMLRQKTGGHYPAPEAILCALAEGLQLDLDNALLVESRYFCAMATGAVAKNLMRLNQLRGGASAPPSAAALRFAALLNEARTEEVAALRAEGVPAALLGNAALAAGLAPLPPDGSASAGAGATGPAGAAASPAPLTAQASALPFDTVRDRLLFAPAVAALRALVQDPLSAGQADLASVEHGGFPDHTGGVLRFIHQNGAFAKRANALGERFALPSGWEKLIE